MHYHLLPTKEEIAIAKSSEEFKNYVVSPFYDYLNKGYIKPWGYEYMAYQSKSVGIWILNMKQGHQTSVHCHFHKDTLLCVISGAFRIDLYEGFKILNEGDVCFIPACMFHGIYSYAPDAVVLEVEIYHASFDITYSDKNDLLRLRDVYTRDKNTYMGSVTEYIKDSATGIDIVNPIYNLHDDEFIYGNTTISLVNSMKGNSIQNDAYNPDILILLDGQIFAPGKMCSILSPGSFIESTSMTNTNNSILCNENECTILQISNLYQADNKKLIYSKLHLIDIMKSNVSDKNAHNNKCCIGLTSGCFDIFHSGHISMLKQSKNMCDLFFVCLSSDRQIREIKGEDRPINNIEDRARMLVTMPFIDYVILYDETDNSHEKELDNIMLIIRPDIWFKGTDYTERTIRAKHPSLKQIVLFKNIENKSTTKIITKINSMSSSSSNTYSSLAVSASQVFM
jgi:rfaE bifunctional protein nucleotidyltransferase chain/domain